MKKIFQITLLLILMSVFTGCLPSYHYGYMGTAPTRFINSPKTGFSNYSGGTISFAGSSNQNENNIAVNLQHQINYTHKWCSLSLHADAYKGFHSVEAIEEYKGNVYDYYGFAPQFSTSLFYPFTSSRLGIYGYTGKFWEFGPYVDWMEKAEADNLITIEGKHFNDNRLFGGGGLLYERIPQENHMVSLRVGLGIPGYISGSIIMQNGKNTFSLGIGGSVFFGYMRAW